MAIEIITVGRGSTFISSRTGKDIAPETAAKEDEAYAAKDASPRIDGLRPIAAVSGSTKKWHRGGRQYRTAYVR